MENDEIIDERYFRQQILNNWSTAKQTALTNATVFVAGCGGLGGVVIYYLVAAGIGNVHICDCDEVALSNLNRQLLFDEESLNKPKVEVAAQKVEKWNSKVKVKTSEVRLSESNVEDIIGHPDLILDCFDNIHSKLILNDYAVSKAIPLLHAGVQEMYGQITWIKSPETPCLRCFLTNNIVDNKPKAIIGASAGILGSIQALEAIKYLTGLGTCLMGRMLFVDGLNLDFKTIDLMKNPDCDICNCKNI